MTRLRKVEDKDIWGDAVFLDQWGTPVVPRADVSYADNSQHPCNTESYFQLQDDCVDFYNYSIVKKEYNILEYAK